MYVDDHATSAVAKRDNVPSTYVNSNPHPDKPSDSQEWRATAEGLNPYSLHRFRVRAVNDVGTGEWSTASNWVRTEGSLSSAGDHDNVEPDVTAVSGKSCCQGTSGFEAENIVHLCSHRLRRSGSQ